MPNDFQYDVFLSHSSKDKAVVRPLAERLRADGLNVWFDEWEIKPGDSIPAKIEEGLEHSRVLVLCMSAQAFGSDWAQLEAGTFRFRDPLNKERRFVPLRLDDAPIKGSLAQFLHIDWRPPGREQEYTKLLEGCRPPLNCNALSNSAPSAEPPVSSAADRCQTPDGALRPAEREILKATPEQGWIHLMRTDIYGQFVSAGNIKFFDPEDASLQAKYLDAFESLCEKRLVQSEDRQAYRLTGRGFELRKQLLLRSSVEPSRRRTQPG